MTPVEQLTVKELDALIAITHADLTWHSEHMSQRIWQAIDQLLDRRLQLTNSCNTTHEPKTHKKRFN